MKVPGVPFHVFEREFMIPPPVVRIFDNAQGGPYKYYRWDGDVKRSFPLPASREILKLVENGEL